MEFLRKAILKYFDIRRGEFIPASLLLVNIFLIILTYITLKPTVSSLFLSRFGVQQLPYVFIVLAVFAAIVSVFYSKILLKVSLNKMILYTNGSGVLFMIIFGVLLNLKIAEDIVLYSFYVWLSIFVVLATSQFWMLTNIIFSVREAKRLFGLVGAGAIAGGILGGYLASILAKLISSNNIVFVAAFLLLFCIPITKYLWKGYVVQKLNTFQQTKRLSGVVSNPFLIVKKSKYLSLIAGIVGLGVIVSKLVDYQFSAIVTSKITDPDELTAFFGFWFSTFNIISLFIQLFLTRRVLGVFGVGTSLLILPIGISIATILLLFAPVLWVAIFLQLNDASFKNSLNRSAVELLSLPIPIEIKSRVKTFIDVFVDRGATGLAGILLIFVIKGLHLPALYINLLIIILIGFWIYLATKIRAEYLKSFQEKLSDPKNNTPSNIDLSKKSVFEGIKEVLSVGTEKQILYMLGKVYELIDQRLFFTIKDLLKHPSEKVRAAALQNLYLYKNPVITNDVRALLNDENDEVKIKVMEYLIARSLPQHREKLIAEFIEHPEHLINSAALVTLAIQSKDNIEWKKTFKTENRIEEKIAHLALIEDEEIKKHYLINILHAIGHSQIEKFYPLLTKHIENEDIDIANQTILAIGNSSSPIFIQRLLEFLLNKDLKNQAAIALSNYGPAIIFHLEKIVKDPQSNIDLIRKIPLVIEKIDSQASIDFLFGLLTFKDVTVRLEVLRAMSQLKIKSPFLKVNKRYILELITEEANLYQKTISVLVNQNTIIHISEANHIESENISNARKGLINILESRLDATLERIFRLIGLKYTPDEIIPIFEGIQAKDADFRANAIEYLDNLLTLDLKKLLMPIIESALMEHVSKETVDNLKVDKLDDIECFTLLMNGFDTKIKMAILFLITELNDPKFLTLVLQQVTAKDKKIKNLAQKTALLLATEK